MGADLLTTNLWSKPDRPSDQFDWEAGVRAGRELSEEACERLVEQSGEYDSWEGEGVSERGHDIAVAHVETLREHLTGYSRVLSAFDTPDGKWTCWLTGGQSWGDSPSDLYDAINDLWVVPEVLAAIGFWVGTEATS